MKHKYIAKRYWDFKIPALSKTNEMSVRYDDVIDLSIGDPDCEVDKGILDAMHQGGLEGHTKYTAFLGDMDLRQEMCDFYNSDFGTNYSGENVMITAGGTHSMYLVLETLLDEGDEVIVISPYYIYYEPQIKLPRGKVVVYSTKSEDGFDIDVKELEKVISPRTKAVVVNSPNNPTGKVYSEESLRGVIELADKHDFVIIADDIYLALNYTDRVKPLSALSPDNPRILTIYSFSKDYSMTGFRLGCVMGEEEIISTIRNVNEGVNFTINAMTQRAGIYALQNRERIHQSLRDIYRERAYYAYERINKIPKMSCSQPEGTFYLFVDIRETGLSSEEIWEKILDDAHVLVLPGSGFGEAGEGFIRIACTTGVDVLEKAFDRIEKMELFK